MEFGRFSVQLAAKQARAVNRPCPADNPVSYRSSEHVEESFRTIGHESRTACDFIASGYRIGDEIRTQDTREAGGQLRIRASRPRFGGTCCRTAEDRECQQHPMDGAAQNHRRSGLAVLHVSGPKNSRLGR